MAGARRVHELAKELGVTSSEILARLHEHGEFAKSASSTLNARVVQLVRDSYGSTIADLAAEIGVPDRMIADYVRRLGRRTDAPLTPHLAAQIRKKFRRAQGRVVAPPDDGAARPTVADRRVDEEGSVRLSTQREPLYVYVRDLASSVVHHQDYLGGRNDRALCGRRYIEPGAPERIVEPHSVCEQCVEALPAYHEKWWRKQVDAMAHELAEIRRRHRQLEERCDKQRKHLAALQQKLEQVDENSQRRSTKTHANNKRRVPKSAVAKRPRKIASGAAPSKGASSPHVVDPQVARKRVKEILGPRPPKTVAEKLADEAARESMRSYKPSNWRVGRSPSSYG
jgi:Translation initiation factor IF-2, N-terminal region